ncbi:MAG: hypothetical protein WA629_15930 [Candidatus Aquilonibacter sp.]
MLASIVLAAAVVLPTPGTYTYRIATPGATFTSTIVVALAFDGVWTHETFGAPVPIAQTDQHFDSSLTQRSFAGAQAGRALTIDISDNSAHYSIDGHNADVPLDHPACTLIEDNILTSSLMLPAVVQASQATQCTFVVSTSPKTIVADVITTPPSTHPAQAAASDAAVTIHLASITETVWYDAETLIPDYIDFGYGQSATLTSRSTSTTMPTPAATATPLTNPEPSMPPSPNRPRSLSRLHDMVEKCLLR